MRVLKAQRRLPRCPRGHLRLLNRLVNYRDHHPGTHRPLQSSHGPLQETLRLLQSFHDRLREINTAPKLHGPLREINTALKLHGRLHGNKQLRDLHIDGSLQPTRQQQQQYHQPKPQDLKLYTVRVQHLHRFKTLGPLSKRLLARHPPHHTLDRLRHQNYQPTLPLLLKPQGYRLNSSNYI